MATSGIARSLSRHMSRLTLSAASTNRAWSSPASPMLSQQTTFLAPFFPSVRTMATNRKVIDAKNARRLKIQQKKKKNTNKAAASSADTEGESASSFQPFLQHQEWVKFQQSISVSGFQTGQVTTATVLKKSRGGKQARRKREKELTRLQGLDPSLAGAATLEDATSTSAAATKFPAIRYSTEETEELLRQAYEALPERTGKRGNRNLRRQERRWKLVRKIRSDYKANIIRAHERRMEYRHYKRQRVIEAKKDAVSQRQKDLEYQGKVLERWYRMQNPVTGALAASNTELSQEEGMTAKA